MKRITLLISAIVVFWLPQNGFAQTPGKQLQKTYTNPLPVAFGDPYVLYEPGSGYYMYGTGAVQKTAFPLIRRRIW